MRVGVSLFEQEYLGSHESLNIDFDCGGKGAQDKGSVIYSVEMPIENDPEDSSMAIMPFDMELALRNLTLKRVGG